MGTSPSPSACDGACCGAFAASSSSFDAACNNLSAHPVLLHGCDTTAELHIRSTSHYVVRNCATAELHIRSTSHYILRSCTTAELHIRSTSHYIVRSCACRQLRQERLSRAFSSRCPFGRSFIFASCLVLDMD